MLSLNSITKDYKSGGETVNALRGVSVSFRKSEFVSVLGQSGCGKTTLLNIIGGLDHYTSGDLSVNGVSTKHFTDKDWDYYRNHSIGFVFQSYNLIPHQTVLSNVELALTVSGISASQRREKAISVLKRVGLADQINKKPNQMSGGQMQRVAIARALVNDPDILLADEPTGALDTETSTQVIDLLKEIASDRLVIMVTHNPALAEQYSTRIIKLLDGKIIDDSNPYEGVPEQKPETEKRKKRKNRSMSYVTAISLSLNNLLTKKTRTLLTSFAGSIGIIGIALILSMSSGFRAYISRVEEDTLSSYPISIQSEATDMTSLMETFMGLDADGRDHDLDKIYSTNVMAEMLSAMMSEVQENDLKSFKAFLDDENSGVSELISGVQYNSGSDLMIYSSNTENGIIQVNPNLLFNELFGYSDEEMERTPTGMDFSAFTATSTSNMDVFDEILDNDELVKSQFELVGSTGRWANPENKNEVMLVVTRDNEISDYSLYSLGVKDRSGLSDTIKKILNGEEYITEQTSYDYEQLIGTEFSLVLNTDLYILENGAWKDMSKNEDYMTSLIKNGEKLEIVGIIRPTVNAAATAVTPGRIVYSHTLSEYVAEQLKDQPIIKEQLADTENDILTGLPFSKTGKTEYKDFEQTDMPQWMLDYLKSLPAEEQAKYFQQFLEQYGEQSKTAIASGATYKGNLKKLGYSDPDEPTEIKLYARDFASKEKLVAIIDEYNKKMQDEGQTEKVINYTDYVGLIMSSISTIIDAISYVLIAFVAISLIVSSIMIGVITYISVLERTKEIGVLRSIGASKKDVSRVFNAETLIVGFSAGALGIIVTLLLLIPINAVIQDLAGIANIAALPFLGGLILVLISMALTLIAGIIPSYLAAKRDPVVALRSE